MTKKLYRPSLGEMRDQMLAGTFEFDATTLELLLKVVDQKERDKNKPVDIEAWARKLANDVKDAND